MARMEPLGIHEVAADIRHICEEAERQSGTSASPRTYARNPAVLKALTAFRTTLAGSNLSTKYRFKLVLLIPSGPWTNRLRSDYWHGASN